jgi:hypothetical protein
MADQDPNPTQQTKPKKGEPVTIPVPKKRDVMDFLEKTAKLPDPDRAKPDPHKPEQVEEPGLAGSHGDPLSGES